jgi:hypothetical protein
VKRLEWNKDKDKLLRETRGLSFSFFVQKIKNKEYVLKDNLNHPNQRIFVIEYNGYPHCIPFVEDEEKIFLKTIFPNRRLK